jgi:hypothetical protein
MKNTRTISRDITPSSSLKCGGARFASWWGQRVSRLRVFPQSLQTKARTLLPRSAMIPFFQVLTNSSFICHPIIRHNIVPLSGGKP